MRLLLQRVSRATAEVSGAVEGRIGLGVVLTLAVQRGDTVEAAARLASKVLKLKLFPDLMEDEALYWTTIAENGFEVLTILQPTLHASFPKLSPNMDSCAGDAEAKKVYEAFVERLVGDYQEEMIAVTPPDAVALQLEMTCTGGGVFEIAGDGPSAAPYAVKAPSGSKLAVAAGNSAALEVVARALRRLVTLPKPRAAADRARLMRILKLPKFRDSISAATQDEMDSFSRVVASAANAFPVVERRELAQLTGVVLDGEANADFDETFPGGDEEGEREGELDSQLAQLQQEVADPSKGIAAAKRRRAGLDVVKEEAYDDENMGSHEPRARPDWNGQAAPDTPSAPHGHWSGHRQGHGGKGYSKGQRQVRSKGIVSLKDSARLHGTPGDGYQFRQASRYSDTMRVGEDEEGGPAKRQAIRLPKGTPTVAPMCPEPPSAEDDL